MPFAQGPPHQQVATSSSSQQVVTTSSGPDSPIGPPSSDTFVRAYILNVDTLTYLIF